MRLRLAPFVASAFMLAAVVVACADSDDTTGTPTVDSGVADAKGKDGSSSSSGNSSSSGEAGCEKATCETVEGKCGTHDDLCGGTFSCGECKDASCTPLTCTALSKTCGTFDDGCGGQVNCGLCTTSCPADGKEPNDKQETAKDLGKASDYANSAIPVLGLQASDGDEDWFKIAVTDGGFGGNPLITATVTDDKLEVSIFHSCTSKPDYSTCAGTGGTQEDLATAKGCFALKTVQLNTECKGIDESGTTFIRVRKRGVDGTCHAYDLNVKVE